MNILGVNAFHGDSSAVLLKDGLFHAGIEEERLNRVKHWAGFPAKAIETVLAMGRITLDDVEHVAISRDPKAHLFEKALFAFKHRPGLDAIRSRLQNHRRVGGLEDLLAANIGHGRPFRGRIHNVEHHRAHLASAFYCSSFEEAACLTIDGFGDFLSSMSAVGRGTRLEILDDVMFPHSLGIFYTAVTQFLGFPKYGDEYKVMGLASYGRPSFLPRMREIVSLRDEGRFETDLDYFRHASDGVTMSWDAGEPTLGPLWSARFTEVFGPAREPGAPISEREHDIAASLQAMYEEAFFHRVKWLQKKTGLKALCLAGGCAMNSVANGKLFSKTGFTDVFIQSAAGDAGTALGAAQYVWHHELGHPRRFVMEHSYWGPEFSEAEIAQAIQSAIPDFRPELAEAPQRCRDLEIRRIWRPPARQASVHGRLLNAAWMIASWGALALEPARTQPDVLIVGTDPILRGLVSIPYARLRPQVRIVHWCFDPYPESAVAEGLLREGSTAHRAISALMDAAYRSFDVIADLGPCMRERLDRYGHGAGRITLPPWALMESPPAADAVAAARRRLFGDARLGILYSGNFGRAHTYEAFLALARELCDADVRFVFAVRGNRADELGRAVGGSSPNVQLAPFAVDSEAPAQLAAADIHLASLKLEWTGLAVPSKFTASLAAGRPFVFAGSPRSALADAIQRHGVGGVLDDSNIPATAAVLRELAQDREKLALIQQRCRTTYSKEFSYSSVLDRWNEELRRLLETTRANSPSTEVRLTDRTSDL